MKELIFGLVAVVSLAALKPLRAEPPLSRRVLGRSVKFRVLVDKVMQPQEKWVTKEWMVREAAEAGFNVLSPRKGFDRLDEVRRVAAWCRKYGLYYMPWMRGSLSAPKEPQADGKRLVWASGNEQPLWSPNSDELWQWMTRYIVEFARISAENDHLIGVFLDFENYAPGKEGNLYDLSYDDVTLRRFAQSNRVRLPQLEKNQRYKWLKEHGLLERFAQFQVEHWRERCRALRKAVDQWNPSFQFCVYPAPGTRFIVEAIYPEWATQKAPLILADACTYGRRGRYLLEQEALKANKKCLLERQKVPQRAKIPFFYIGGIDPAVRGADPEFCGKNAVGISETVDGYWIFYEGPSYTKEDHAQYWKWFTWANRAIADGRFELQYQPRKAPESWQLAVFRNSQNLPAVEPLSPSWSARPASVPLVRLRRENLVLLYCRRNVSVCVSLANLRVGNYQSRLLWEVRDPSGERVASGRTELNEDAHIEFKPTRDGVYRLGATADGRAWAIRQTNVPLGLSTVQPLHVIRGAERLYFVVPQHLRQFTIGVEGGGGTETVRLNVFDPAGQLAGSIQTTPQRPSARLTIDLRDNQVEKDQPPVWSLQLTRADQGVLEDCCVQLDPKLPPVLSLVPEHAWILQ